ncbi:hypothetical protein KSC_060480 [Ktedonobacter sp. SOSP1-52]|uniref:aminopeptidase n=1 Tax=Ktedonobacter sp. SOSP1-52 TaxID=2778366 RepID=UPI001915528C|nr:aminopeptidase [Ktedonobacter sp. SOSP1-52]GHO67156.1 hypothetical protein KSC_060480 [Ktedonobacter sp. SOSP1-52]
MSIEQQQTNTQAPLDARLQRGAENAVKCMGIGETDRVFIITDEARQGIADRIAQAARARHAQVETVLLEQFGSRPLTVFTDEFRQTIQQAQPTVTFYIATAQPGEISFRIPLLPFLQQLGVRHGHMIGIDEQLMMDGMCADYDEVFAMTNKVYAIVREAKHIRVTSPKGTDVSATFHPEWKWIPCHGRYTTSGAWGNLPEGEVFTAPASVDGVLVCEVLGDFFSEKYGVLEQPLTIKVENGYITEISSVNNALAQEVHDYLFSTPNGNRAGEFAIGTLTSLKRLVGNLLQDEKMPGLHVAFGNPYPEFTGADWDAKVHVDVIPTQCTIEIDGRIIMRDGVFTL